MSTTPIQISHDRLVKLKPIEAHHDQYIEDHQSRYFIYEIDDNQWQNVNPEGETDYDLESIKQEPAQIPVGILSIDNQSDTYSFEGDLTITQEDQKLIFESVK